MFRYASNFYRNLSISLFPFTHFHFTLLTPVHTRGYSTWAPGPLQTPIETNKSYHFSTFQVITVPFSRHGIDIKLVLLLLLTIAVHCPPKMVMFQKRSPPF